MPNFKRVSLIGSEELFRPTRPQVVEGTDEVIKETVDRPGMPHVREAVYHVSVGAEEIDLLLEAVQVAKYPDRPRAKPALDKFDALDALRLKIQTAKDAGPAS